MCLPVSDVRVAPTFRWGYRACIHDHPIYNVVQFSTGWRSLRRTAASQRLDFAFGFQPLGGASGC
jgi:hypothetical protein